MCCGHERHGNEEGVYTYIVHQLYIQNMSQDGRVSDCGSEYFALPTGFFGVTRIYIELPYSERRSPFSLNISQNLLGPSSLPPPVVLIPMSAQRSSLCSVPIEVLDNIAFELVSDTPHGPPSALLPLLLTCKDLHRALSPPGCVDLYARIFKAKFDHLPVARRAFKPRSSQYLDQLVDYCKLLQIIRSGDIYYLDIDNVLFMALIMMTENDGKNRAQLEWAGLDEFVHRFARERLYENRELYNGWPGESPQNACALWLMWMMTTEGT